MFRSIVCRVVKPIGFSVDAQKLGFCTKVPLIRQRFRREVNEVKLVGTLISDSFTLQSGTKSLTLRTNDAPTKHSNHNIHLRTEANFTAGQRIYVTGKLRSGSVRTSDGKTVTASTVKANQLYVLDNESGTKSASTGDRNHVEVLGNIASEVTKKNDHSTFAVATHYDFKNPEDGTISSGTSFHRVFAYDPELFRFCEDKLKTRDRVLLTGKIAHMTYTGDDGKRLYSSYIVAENIYRIPSRSSSADVASDEKTQLNSESG